MTDCATWFGAGLIVGCVVTTVIAAGALALSRTARFAQAWRASRPPRRGGPF